MPRKDDGFKALAVIQNEENRVPNQVLAEEIRAIAEGMRTLMNAGLTDECIAMLVWGAIPTNEGTSLRTVQVVLFKGLAQLEKKYLKGRGAA
jgi:hypothetical protein